MLIDESGDGLRNRDGKWLRYRRRPPRKRDAPVLDVVDLFCGCGGMSLGLEEAARRNGSKVHIALAVDNDPVACSVYKSNFPDARVIAGDVVDMFGGDVGDELTEAEELVARGLEEPSVLQGGPPCQGHSDLNNHTRRHDPKNALYLRMARAAEVLRPKIVIIENVPPVQWDLDKVVEATTLAFEKLDYAVDGAVIDLSRLGVPQRRRRHITIASSFSEIDPVEVVDQLLDTNLPIRDVEWAIEDLESIISRRNLDEPSRMHVDNQRRVDYLFDQDRYNLPNDERPPCHQNDDHSYKSMYGRLEWNEPAQTITTGFTSMGQGRFVHPSQRRTLTPHEAARLQTFPDWFKWGAKPKRTALSTMIGNAVPPLMMVRIGELLLPELLGGRAGKLGR